MNKMAAMRPFSRTVFRAFLPCAFFLALLLSAQSGSAQTLYVDEAAGGNNDGSSWANAYRRLSTALNIAQNDISIQEIRVAAGTYFPATANIDATFAIYRGGLKIYGGYPSGGGIRDIVQYPTILDGNISPGSSRHVVVIAGLPAAADSVVLDGFIIQNGLANQLSFNVYNGINLLRNRGGGIAILNCGNGGKTAIRNCRIESNRAHCVSAFMGGSAGRGGGMYINEASPLVFNCVFSKNSGNSINVSPQEPIPSYIRTYGTAMFVEDGSPVITNCVFYGNTGGDRTIFAGDPPGTTNPNPSFRNCIVYGNSNGVGFTAGSLTFSNSIVQGGWPGSGNTSGDPLFINAAGGDFRLQPGSPAINSGNNSFLPANSSFDLYGGERILNGTVDRGVHEYGNLSLFGPVGMCIGDTAVYTGSPAGGTYSNSNSAVATLTTTGIITGISAGTDTITYAVGTAIVRKIITVSIPPSVSSIIGRDTLCAGTSITLSSATTGGVWSSSSTARAVVNNSTGIVSGLSAGTLNIIHTVSHNGCSNSVTAPLTVLPQPVISVSGGNSFPLILCVGDARPLTATPSGGTWTNSNPAVASLQSGNVTGLQTGTATFTYTATGTNGCTRTVSKTVTVNADPVPVITSNLGALTASVNGQHMWLLNGVPIPGATEQTYTPTQSGSYTVTVTTFQGSCTGTSAPFIVSNLISGPEGLCLGTTAAYTGSPGGGSYSNSNPAVASISASGIVTAIAAGTDTITYTIDTVIIRKVIIVFPAPFPVIMSSGNMLTADMGQAPSFFDFSWSRNGIPITGATMFFYTPAQNGSYIVTATDQFYGCTGTSAPVNVTITAADLAIDHNRIQLFPNPAADVVFIDAREAVRVELSTLDGRLIIRQNNARELRIASLPEGAYVIAIYDKKGELLLLRDKLIKMNR